ncbi:hypothetical protein VDGL01_07360 [Verticillium dahliae]
MSLLNLLTAGYCVKRASLGPIAGASLHVRVRDWPESLPPDWRPELPHRPLDSLRWIYRIQVSCVYSHTHTLSLSLSRCLVYTFHCLASLSLMLAPCHKGAFAFSHVC